MHDNISSDLTEAKTILDILRPLDAARLALLFPRWRAEEALFVYATNAIEGSTLTEGETIVVLQTGVTIGGKPLADHLDAVKRPEGIPPHARPCSKAR